MKRPDARGLAHVVALFAALAAAVVVLGGLVVGLAWASPWFAALHDRWGLWLVALVHAHEGWLAVGFPLLALFLASATFARWPRTALVVLAAATVGIGLYLFVPWGLVRYASPWHTTLLVAPVIYLALRWQWARWTFLYPAYRACLRAVVRAYPRGEPFFAGRDVPRFTAPGDPGAWLGRLLAWLSLPGPAAPGEADPLWTAEIERRRHLAWERLQRLAFSPGSPTLAALAEARREFRVWLATTDALAECHASDLQRAAALYAEAARVCLRPTYRVGFDWFEPAEGGTRTAAFFHGRERACLERLAGADRAATATPTARLTAARLVVARWTEPDAQARGHEDPCLRVGLRSMDWEALADALHAVVWGVLLDPDSAGPLAAWAVDCRLRWLDLCEHAAPPQTTLALEELDDAVWHRAVALPEAARDEQRRADLSRRGRLDLAVALHSTGLVRDEALRSALAAFHAADDLWLVGLTDRLASEPGLSPDRITAARPRTTEPAVPPQIEPTPDEVAAARRPNAFVRWPVVGVALGAAAVVFGVLSAVTGEAVVPAPDLRLGPDRRQGPVAVLAGGPEVEPSLWLGTPGEGVHVKAAGLHHYYRVCVADGLPTDDVRHLHVTADRVAFVCADGGRVGLTLGRLVGPPGVGAALSWSGWSTKLPLTRFGDVSDADLTAFRQDDGCPLLLVGTRGKGLGRYDVAARAWLDPLPLRPGYGEVTDLVTYRDGDDWHAWVATPAGVEGGPIHGNGRWHRLGLAAVEQLAGQGRGDVLYRTRSGGLGRIDARQPTPTARVLVNDTRVEGLAEASLRRVAYAADGRRVWLLDDRGRIVLYREADHTLLPSALGPAEIRELAAAGERAFLGGEAGLVRATDHGDRVVVEPVVSGMPVHRVAAGPGGVAFLSGDAAHHFGDRLTTLIGPGRVAGLADADITSVARPDANTLLLGREKKSIVQADLTTRQVREAFPGLDDTRTTFDLLGPVGGRLLRVVEGETLEAIDWEKKDRWVPVLAALRYSLDPARVVSIRACRDDLYVATPDDVARYRMAEHAWDAATPPKGVTVARLVFGAGRLWMEDAARTLWLFDPDARAWSSRFAGVRAVSAGEAALFVLVDRDNAVWRVDAAAVEKPTEFARRTPLPRPANPDVACLSTEGDAIVYVAPVTDEAGRLAVGRYDADRGAWTTLLLPDRVDAVVQLARNATGLWLVGRIADGPSRLFLHRGTSWSEVIAGPVAKFSASPERALALLTKGELVSFDAAGKPERRLVGSKLVDLEPSTAWKATPHAAEFDGDLFLAVGPVLGRYATATHGWSRQLDGTTVAELVPTAGFLYARTDAGRLYRLGRGVAAWRSVEGLFPAGLPIASIAPLGDRAVGVVVPGRGAYALADDQARPRPLALRSEGPKDGDPVHAAAEADGDLLLGGEGVVWAYATRREGDRLLPPTWQRVVAAAGRVRQLLPEPDGTVLLHGEGGVFRLRRAADRTWSFDATALHRTAPHHVAVSTDGVHLAEADGLRFLPRAGEPVTRVAARSPRPGSATRSVAVDPKDATTLYRADADGRVLRYRAGLTHRGWDDVSTPEGKGVAALRVAGGVVWAWLPGEKVLYHRDGNAWRRFPKEVDQFGFDDGVGVALEKRTLFRSAAWTWHSDESVECCLPFTGNQPCRSHYDVAAGRFGFDAVRGLATRGKEAFVVTDAGIQTADAAGVRGLALNDDPAFREPVEATVLTGGLTGFEFVEVNGEAPAYFALGDAGWRRVEPGAAKAALAARDRLVEGVAWRVERSGVAVDRPRAVWHQSGGRPEPIRLRDGVLDTDRVTAVAGLGADRAVLATAGGLRFVGPGGWGHVPTAAAVERLGRDGDRVQVRYRDGTEELRDPASGAVVPGPVTPFARRDETRLAGADWRVAFRDGAVTMHRRFGENDWREAAFDEGRFDHDQIRDAAVAESGVALVTAGGFVVLADRTTVPRLEATPVALRRLWWDGAERLVALTAGGSAYLDNKAGWERVAAADLSRSEAGNGRWNLTRTAGRLGFRLTVRPGDAEQAFPFDAARGAFRADLYDDLSHDEVRGEVKSVTVATGAGVAWLSSTGGWVRFRNDPARPGTWRSEEAVNSDPAKSPWRVERKRPAPGVGGFELHWRGERVHLSPVGELRFEHDRFRSTAWDGDALWILGRGALMKFGFVAGEARAPATGSHLWALPLGPEPRLLRPDKATPGSWLVADAAGNHRLAYSEAERRWVATPLLEPIDAIDPVAHLGSWRMDGAGRVRLHRPAAVFGEADYATFAGGTFGHWDLRQAVAWHDGAWVVATGVGAHWLEADGVATRRVDPLGPLTDLRVDAGRLFARTATRTYRFEDATWVEATDFPERDGPVDSGWLRWRPGPDGVRVAFRDGGPAGSLLEDGRFRFDQVRDVIHHDGRTWLLTAAGVVELKEGGAMLHHAGPAGIFGLSVGGASLGRVARNELFEIRREAGRAFSVRFHVGTPAEWRLGQGPALLSDGVFAFDDWRDATLFDDAVVAATRMGPWEHRLAFARPLGPPAAVARRPGDPSPDVRSWDDGDVRWRLVRQGDLAVEKWRGERLVDRQMVARSADRVSDAVATPTAIWLRVGGEVFWVRKDRFRN